MRKSAGRRARRIRPIRVTRVALAALASLLSSLVTIVAFVPAASAATTFTNSSAITITSPAYSANETPQPASVYPSNITVSGQTGTLSHLSVTLNNVSHTSSDDVDVLLVAPNNKAFVLVSDAGSNRGGSGPWPTSNSTVTFDDTAASTIPQLNSAWGPANGSTTVKPVDYSSGSTDLWPSPAPAATTTPRTSPAPTGSGTLDGVFGGANPNGTWSLYVVDDTDGANGSIAGGWSLNLTTASAAVPTTTSVTSSPNPSRTGNSVTFSAQVTKSGGTPTGNVTFKEGTTTLATSPVNGSGLASFSTSALTEGQHTITAVYGGDPTSATSSGSVTQTVDNNTTVSGGSYCNTGPVTLTDSANTTQLGVASPYPSRVFISGVGGAISNLTLTLKNLTEPNLEDIDLLLVGPGGQRFLVVSDAGGPSNAGGSVTNSTVTFDDGASFVPLKSSGGWGTSAQPVDYTDTTDSFPSPAPSSWSSPQPTGAATFASVFGGTDPNGTWSLYAVDDTADGGNGGSIGGGWCLNVTSNSDAATTTSVVSSSNPSTIGSPVTFTAHVVENAGGSNVQSGTVTFRDGGTTIGAPVVLDANGQASVTTSSLTEGSHTITAAYSGRAGQFNISTGQLTQQVDSPTAVQGTRFCNNGGITVRDPSALGQTGTASPYPSHVSVSNVTGSGANLSVALNGVTHGAVGDLDVLLVAPDGTALKLVSDAGGDNAVSNVNAHFEDDAPGTLPENAAWGTPGSAVSSKPIDYDTGTDTFPAPAPAPSVTTLAALSSGNVNGVWSLYVVDDTLGQTGSIGSWCMTVTTPPTASPDAYSTTENTNLSVDAAHGLLANDTGFPAPTATPITGGTTAQGGTVNLSADGSFTYAPPAGFLGTDSFIYTSTNAVGTSAPATVSLSVTGTPAPLVISSFRLAGPSGAADDYVDLFNPTGGVVNLSGWKLGYSGGAVSLPNVPLSAHGSYLIAGSAYSLGGYAAADLSPAGLDLPATGGLQVVAPDASVTDAAGPTSADPAFREGSGLATPSQSSAQLAYQRRIGSSTGTPVDTNVNTADFQLVATDADTNDHAAAAVLGAPAPMDLTSPVAHYDIAQSALLDSGQASSAAPNRVYNSATQTLTVRRTITNTSATQTLTSMRLRLTSISTYGATGTGQAILLAQNSPTETIGGKTVQGLTLDQPPAQPSGGGLGSSLTVPLPAGGLAPGQSVNVNIAFHAVRTGSFAFVYVPEVRF